MRSTVLNWFAGAFFFIAIAFLVYAVYAFREADIRNRDVRERATERMRDDCSALGGVLLVSRYDGERPIYICDRGKE